MKNIFTISLLLVITSCGLYISETTDSSYEDMISSGLSRVVNNPLVVEDLGHKYKYVEIEEVEYSHWKSRETISHNNRSIDTYISSSQRCVLLVPLD